MIVTFEIPEKIAQQLKAAAQSQGLSMDAYMISVLQRAVSRPSLPSNHQLSRSEFVAALDAMAQYSDKIPAMPGETFSREVIYRPD